MPLPNIDTSFTLTTELCSYCNTNKAIVKYKNGKFCCEEHYSQCPEIKKKNTNGLKQAYKTGKLNATLAYEKFSEESKNRMAWSRGKSLCVFESKTKIISNTPYKKSLISERGHQCELCKNTEWICKPITLELDHIDGDRTNNTKENLRLLCPNCHSQTSNWRGKNINTFKKKVSDEDMINAYLLTGNIHKALINVGLAPKGGNYSRMKKLIVAESV